MAEYEEFIPPYYAQIEKSLEPLFEYVLHPEQIEFEEDIVLILKTFIKKM